MGRIDEQRLKDPMFWFVKASAYCSASLCILEECEKLKSGDEPSHLIKALDATPYLTGLAVELYMKGYLVFKGVDPVTLREKRIGHKLEVLRKMCLEYGDSRFKSKPLIFLSDTLGKDIMEDGGIRYPGKKGIAIYVTKFQKALNVLQKIARDVQKEITDKEK